MTTIPNIYFGCFKTDHETLSRVIPSPFSLLKKRDFTEAEQALAKAIANAKKSTSKQKRMTHTVIQDDKLYFGSIAIPFKAFVNISSTQLIGWSTDKIQSTVPFSRILKAMEIRAQSPPNLGPLAPRGLTNTANECFANAVLQMLIHCQPLREWCELGWTTIEDYRQRKGNVCVPGLIEKFFTMINDYRNENIPDNHNAWSPFAKPLPPLSLSSSGIIQTVLPHRRGAEQQDAEEFLSALLNQLHSNLLNTNENENISLFDLDESDDEFMYTPPSTETTTQTTTTTTQTSSSSSSTKFTSWADADEHDDFEQFSLEPLSSLPSNNAVSTRSNDSNLKNGDSSNHLDLTKSLDTFAEDANDWTEVGPGDKKSVIITSDSDPHSPISRLLRGRLRSTLQKRNAKPSISIEPFFTLSLKLPQQPNTRKQPKKAVSSAIHHLLAQSLGNERVNNVAKSGHAGNADKHVALESAPASLILHVARFVYADGHTKKIHTNVKFNMNLDVSRELFSGFAQSSLRSDSIRYKLRGVVRHHGISAESGHYTATIAVNTPNDPNKKHQHDWYLFNDTHVEHCTPAQVLSAQDSVYLLIYQRDDVL